MKIFSSLIISSLLGSLSISAQEKNQPHLSIKLEIKRAIERGNAYLQSKQNVEGYWGEAKYPAVSALSLTAAVRSPSYQKSEYVVKGFNWILSQQQPDGGIYSEGLGTYNTATSLTALVAANNDISKKHIGGIGYGGTYKHSDLSNTHLAMEALRLSRHIAQDDIQDKQPELNWDAALEFVSRTQNLKNTNKEPGISNDGSFVYFPGNSKAGNQKNSLLLSSHGQRPSCSKY